MIKLGILSFAHMHAWSYAQAIQSIPGVELTAIWGENRRRIREAARKLKTRCVSDINAFLAEDLDGVVICSENAKHHAMVELAASAGKWVLCEKPLAPTSDEALAIVEDCADNGVGLMTAFPCRFVPSIVEARQQLLDGNYGDIYAVTCTNHGRSPGGWFVDEALSGGGAVMDHTVHVADLLRWMLDREFTHVYCEADNVLHSGEFDTDDLGALHLEMEDGVEVMHVASWTRPDSFPTWGDVTLEFVGSGGVLSVDAFNQKLNVYSNLLQQAQWAPWGDNPDAALIAEFVAAIREQRVPSVTGEDGLRATRVTEAAYKSLRSGKRVAV